MKHKFDVFGIFKKWKAQVEIQTSKKIKYLRTNNGLENRDKEFIRFYELLLVTSQLKELHSRMGLQRE